LGRKKHRRDDSNNLLYEDNYLKITKHDEAGKQSRIDIGEINGEKTFLLGFTEVTNKEGKMVFAYKIRGDKPLALYYVLPRGEEAFGDFEEAVSQEFPDHEIVDMKVYFNHHVELEKKYGVFE